jgi:23S rRNA pseudouridine1911/1915/1917 synthase
MPLNQGFAYRSRVDARAAGGTLLDYLFGRWTHSSRAEWLDRIVGGEIDVERDTPATHPARTLALGERVTWRRPPWHEPDVPLHYEVLYEDETLLAVAKPSGLPTMAAGGFLTHTLVALVQARDVHARPLHRLGRYTSGIVLFARRAEVASALARAWRRHEVQKRYRALSDGVADRDRYVIETPIGPVPYGPLGTLHAASPTGKPSSSAASVVRRRVDTTLFDVDITTGRPHQIRIHLASIGHPLVGDPLYGSGGMPKADGTALPGDGGYLLHAERLRLVHPLSGVPLEICAAAPPALR